VIDKVVYTKAGENNAGLDFISQFNWLIDFRAKKMYAQQRNNLQKRRNTKALSLYSVMIKDNKLVISTRNKTANLPLKLTDVIKAVNGEKRT
jgi:hypothetical protein